MSSYIQTFLGILVSVGLFVITYRQTIGASKERAKAANKEIENILLKRVILEDYIPSLAEISRLIEGKARDHSVKKQDLFTELQIINLLFTRIMESDYIEQEKRDNIRTNLSMVVNRTEAAQINKEGSEFLEFSMTGKIDNFNTRPSIILIAVISVITGAVVAIFPLLENIDKESLLNISSWIGSLVSSLIIALIFFFIKFREKEESETGTSSLLDNRKFEETVFETINKISGVRFELPAFSDGIDFIVDKSGKRVVIEVKEWTKTPHHLTIKATVMKLSVAADKKGADFAILVLKKKALSRNINIGEKVSVMSVNELEVFLKKL